MGFGLMGTPQNLLGARRDLGANFTDIKMSENVGPGAGRDLGASFTSSCRC